MLRTGFSAAKVAAWPGRRNLKVLSQVILISPGAPGLAPSFSSRPSDDLVSAREQVDQVPTNQVVTSGKTGLARLSM